MTAAVSAAAARATRAGAGPAIASAIGDRDPRRDRQPAVPTRSRRAGAAGLGGRQRSRDRQDRPAGEHVGDDQRLDGLASCRGRRRLVAMRAMARISAVAPNAPTRGSLRISRRRALVDVRADRVGDVGEAVLVQRAGDQDGDGDREERGGERREDLVGGGSRAGGGARRRAGRRAGRPTPRGSGPGRGGGGTGRRVRKASAVLTARARRSAGRRPRGRRRGCARRRGRGPRSGGRRCPGSRSRSTCPRGTLTSRKFAAPG